MAKSKSPGANLGEWIHPKGGKSPASPALARKNPRGK